eukprot:CAMPEP_0174731380 /NCGR_PEP_ID=MMETSP1094-20130205/57428_1 /TAXON_ID=156173 /ORGANISM="Chrysochromulina brevifilum, Strain UTEX LB 985" /LENGTH=39 /DNA_ID= /DNA_START= /DNA_END= /DNA_ORIENTATION=
MLMMALVAAYGSLATDQLPLAGENHAQSTTSSVCTLYTR